MKKQQTSVIVCSSSVFSVTVENETETTTNDTVCCALHICIL